jgi:nicotinamide-nucleotide amidase
MNDNALALIEKLKKSGKTISVAESLTGGLLAQELTAIAGASEVFKGSITAYLDEVKIGILKIDSELIKKHSSISAQVAESMAVNICQIMNSDIGLATTGVAGPEPSAGFAPGTVFVAVATKDHKIWHRLVLVGDRQAIREQSVNEVLKLALSQVV